MLKTDQEASKEKFKLNRSIYNNIYTDTVKHFSLRKGCLSRIVFKWKGSVWKLIWHYIVIFCIFFASLSGLYHFAKICEKENFNHETKAIIRRHRENFELLCIYCHRFQDVFPVTMLVGFYVRQVAERWWEQCMMLPWPDQFAMKLVTSVDGEVRR